ncbi:hypothetical protein E308F_30130 [Moorella sp. E308F]|uniref:hypothetical protein n=1 Tax=Moorella sp. E308F TaxID=2572682 RepID=UPI0010FFBAB9|nr:hypothetical protein [Moorella sp. E308F]GEA16767.1 hypothetical protein E308F_30130 [Moorella sp. E308F]
MADFKYVETITKSQDLLNTIKEILTFTSYPFDAMHGETEVANTWIIKEEITDVATGKIKELTVQGKTAIGSTTVRNKDFYVRFKLNGFSDVSKHSSMTVQLLDEFNPTNNSYGVNGYPVLYEWAQENYSNSDRDFNSPVYLYATISNNRIAMVLVADPAINFNDYRKSFLYIGAIQPFKFNEDDVDGNILLTAGAYRKEPSYTEIAINNPDYYFGEFTATGNNNFQMLKTKTGILFQKHYPAFITQAPPPGSAYVDSQVGDTGVKLESQGFQASRWTGKYHMSPIYVYHPYEGYRGQLDGCVAVTKHNILHLDELVVDVEGKPWTQEVYRFYDINTEQCFTKHSANINMGLAVLKEVRY